MVDETNNNLKNSASKAKERRKTAIVALESVPLETTDLLTNHKGIEEEEVRISI